MSLKELEKRLTKEFESIDVPKELLKALKKEENSYDRAGILMSITEYLADNANILTEDRARSVDPPLLYFNGKVYQYLDFNLFRKCIRLYLFSKGMTPKDWIRFINRIMQVAKEATMLKKFQPHPRYIAFQNCVVDFETFTPYKFTPDIHVTYQLDYDFDMEADCPIFKTFLKQVLPDKQSRRVIQQFFGLAFLDRYNNEHKVEKALILVGEGSNGKSVIFETLMNTLGSMNISNMDLASLAKGGDEGMRNMAMLEHKRFNYCSEEQIGKVIQRSDVFKTLVSGEPIYARRIGQNSFRITNLPFLVFNMNKLPQFNDDTHGLFRRLLIVGFTVIIPDELQDKQLAHKIRGERSGILRWLYEGYLDLKANDFIFDISAEMRRVALNVVKETSSLVGWEKDRRYRPRKTYGYINDDSQDINATDLYEDYKDFCKENDKTPITQAKFGREMIARGYNKERTMNGVCYTVYGGKNEKLVLDPELLKQREKLINPI